MPPGMDELFSLLQIKRHHESGEFDAVIVDCAPTGETLRLLSFPDIAHWWLEKVFPWERRLVAAARPIAQTDRRRRSRRGRDRRGSAPGPQPDRDERDPSRSRTGDDPAGDEPRPDGDQGGAADLHLPQPLRLPDRRGDRQPGLSRRARRRLLRRMARAPVGAARRGRAGLRAGAGADRALLRRGGDRREDARPPRRGALSRRPRSRRRPAQRALAADLRRENGHDQADDQGSVRRPGRPLAEEGRRRADRLGRAARSGRSSFRHGLARQSPTGAKLADGSLEVSFAAREEALVG